MPSLSTAAPRRDQVRKARDLRDDLKYARDPTRDGHVQLGAYLNQIDEKVAYLTAAVLRDLRGRQGDSEGEAGDVALRAARRGRLSGAPIRARGQGA